MASQALSYDSTGRTRMKPAYLVKIGRRAITDPNSGGYAGDAAGSAVGVDRVVVLVAVLVDVRPVRQRHRSRVDRLLFGWPGRSVRGCRHVDLLSPRDL